MSDESNSERPDEGEGESERQSAGQKVLDDDEIIDIDHLIEDLEAQRHSDVQNPEPAWRRLERYMEDKRTAEEISDFEDYDLD